MYAITQSECSIVLVVCKAAVAALQDVEVEGGVTLTGPTISIVNIQYIDVLIRLPHLRSSFHFGSFVLSIFNVPSPNRPRFTLLPRWRRFVTSLVTRTCTVWASVLDSTVIGSGQFLPPGLLEESFVC